MTPRYTYYIAVSQTLNFKKLAKLKRSLKICLVVYQGPRWRYSIKKHGVEISRETFPLKPLIFPLSSEKSDKSADVHLWGILYLTPFYNTELYPATNHLHSSNPEAIILFRLTFPLHRRPGKGDGTLSENRPENGTCF
jgi:hypothetical protein